MVLNPTLAIVLAGLLAPAAAAGRSIPIEHPPLGGPALAGPGVAWIEPTGTVAALVETPYDGSPTSVQRFEEEAEHRVGLSYLEASSSRLMMAKGLLRVTGVGHDQNVASDGFEALTGGWGERLPTVRERCNTGEGTVQSTDVDGETVAYASCAAAPGEPSGSSAAGVVVDYSTAPPNEDTVPGAGLGIRVAGRYLAWLERPEPSGRALFALKYDVVVFDRVARLEVYRIPAGATRGGLRSFDLQDDGKLAVALADVPHAGEDPMTRIAWASVLEPTLHDLPARKAASYSVRIANNTIGFERTEVADDVVSPGEVGVASLDGRERVVARNGEANIRYPSFDYDGTRLAWWSYGCRKPRIQYLDAGSRSGPKLSRSGCRLTFKQKPRLVSRSKVSFRVDCRGFFGCSVAKLTITRRHRPAAIIARGRGRSARLTPLGRAALRRPARVQVRVKATITDAAGRREKRATTMTLYR